MKGLMQDTPLLISGLLRHAAMAHPRRQITSRLVDEPTWRYDYLGLEQRAAQAAHMLQRMGIKAGDRVSSLGWNTHRHMELMFAVPGIGAILHTANPRLTDEQIIYTIEHAESSVVFYERSFAGLVDRIAPLLPNIRHYIMLSDSDRTIVGSVGAQSSESLLAQEISHFEWPKFDEGCAAFLCYTSGTTGNPKGVLYSHRSTVLHAMASSLTSAFALDVFDCIMPCSSFYHATGWGLPFAGALNGCAFALPCDRMDAASLHELVIEEGVTFTCGVPTIWTMFLDYLDRHTKSTGSLQRIVIGGSAVPRAMAEAFDRIHGVKVLQLWGMTELNPVGVVATPTPAIAAQGEKHVDEIIWTRQGRMQFGVELQITDDNGNALPHDGETSGTLKVRGPWTIKRYFRAKNDAVDADDWFDTGDIATIDADGYLRITDRAKDVIKSGGEWISSIDIENIVAGMPDIKIAAVIGVYHPKWEERPVLVIERHDGSELSMDSVQSHLAPLIAKWWMPDRIIFDHVPLTSTGKIDKKALRQRYVGCLDAE
ncbi:long-chain fatty acid--CoA ligase [Kordiimonas pumila]|uniref:Long-chain fatty acid--CoA ligase n=1 Tax=Kordiimonas pumila TaxID=2161677 RepID=A0ABV7D594_9PROT|nr:long-chain fatty acid--CoA ligase [Kordiimonas pumila]